MMILLTDEEYRALQHKPCSTCDTIRKELEDKVMEAQLIFTQEVIAMLNSVTANSPEISTKLSESLSKMRKFTSEPYRFTTT